VANSSGRGRPLCEPAGHLFVGDVEVEPAGLKVDLDNVTVADGCERATRRCFGRDLGDCAALVPEILPSVTNAMRSWSPRAASCQRKRCRSRMPGSPLGPTYRITTTSPAATLPAARASQASSSLAARSGAPPFAGDNQCADYDIR